MHSGGTVPPFKMHPEELALYLKCSPERPQILMHVHSWLRGCHPQAATSGQLRADMSRGGEGWGLITRAYLPCYRVLSFLYSFKAYFGISLGFLLTYCVTNNYLIVCFIIYSMNKVHGIF